MRPFPNPRPDFPRKTLVSVLICLLAATLCALSCIAVSATPKASVGNTRTIVIDAGHGGIDVGTVGVVTGNKESDLNLIVSRCLEQNLSAIGFATTMTRTDENGLYGNESPGFKRRDMLKRAQIIGDAAPSLVISIHMNKYLSPSRRGAQVYFQKGDETSRVLANVLQSALNAEINLPEGGRAFEAISGDFYVCKTSPCPAVIIECGFLSNPIEDRLLATHSYRQRLANVIKNGICEYLALNAVAP